ncbi:MAG: hypothetical protein E6Q40_02100 [Cupriavidus sp.]|nr:MAG: hypothetical protein E6Q40_02100 [Cupriavidus sp.]
MANTLRSQNKCNDCRYTWYPRGKNLSRVCPNCGSENVAVVTNWTPFIAVAAVGLYLAFGGKSNNSGATSGTPAPPVEAAAPVESIAPEQPRPEPAAMPARPREQEKEEYIEPARALRPREPEVSPTSAPAPAQEPAVSVNATAPAAPAPVKIDEADRTYTDEEISALENQKQYHGNDPIVRSRLGIPSRETRKLIR